MINGLKYDSNVLEFTTHTLTLLESIKIDSLSLSLSNKLTPEQISAIILFLEYVKQEFKLLDTSEGITYWNNLLKKTN